MRIDQQRADAGTTNAQAAADNAQLAREEFEAKQAQAGGPNDEKAFTRASGLRKEFTAATKGFAEQNSAYGRVLASAQDPSAAGDLALIFNFMKILDPGSNVREGEFATARNAGSIPSRIRALYNKLKDGEQLDADQRADFVGRAGRLFSCLLYTSPSPRDRTRSRMPSSA